MKLRLRVLAGAAALGLISLAVPLAAETVIGGIDLGITKDVDAADALPGDTLVYTLVATNYGEAGAREGYVTDVLPDGVTFVGVDDPACSHDAGVIECYFPLWLPITLDPVAAVKTITVTVTVDDDFAGTLVNLARVENRDPAEGAPEDGDPTNDEATAETVVPVVDPPGAVGDTVFEDLDGNGVQDAGDPGIPDVTVLLTAGTETRQLITDSDGHYLFEQVIGAVTVTLDETTLPAGYTYTTASQFDADIGFAQEYLDADFGIMFAEEAIIDLELTKSASPTEFTGQPPFATTFTLTVTNQGPAPATGVVVRDVLPLGVGVVDWDPFGEAAAVGGAPDPTEVIWFPGDLAVGESKTLTIDASVSDFGSFVNTAEVSQADQQDIDSTPNDGEGDDYDEASVGGATVNPTDASIGDTVFLDSNNNGVQDTGEPGIAGATVTLTTTSTTITKVTDASGLYLFAQLPAGDYTVTVDQGTVGDNLGITTAASFLVSLADGEHFLDADFGFTPILPATGLAGDMLTPLGLALLAFGAFALRLPRRVRRV